MSLVVEQDPRIARCVEWLLTLDDRAFRAEVDADLRTPRDSDDRTALDRYQVRRAALRSPEVVERWYMTLSMILKSVEGQLASMQEDHEAQKARLRREIAQYEHAVATSSGDAKAKAEKELRGLRARWETARENYARQRGQKLRFKTGLDEWLVEARSLRDQARGGMYESVVTEERNHYAAEAKRLRDAIREHQAAILEADDDEDTTSFDEKLWAVLG